MSRALGRYELLRPLARGGMGEVYLARRRAAGVEKWLVVKRMRPERSGDTRFLDLFMREARLSMSLAHQNIVPVFDFGRMDDQVFLAMERVEGKDLGSSLARAGKALPPLLAAFIAAECLQALDYAHRRKGPDGAELGIVHRDVTPRNVLLSWSGEVKLTDFGIAALAGDSPSRTAGTPAYMAPEQARGEDTDVRADIYAVGLVLREALTGERARRGNDRETVMDLAKQGVLEPWPDNVDTTLKAIADRATRLDRTERYPDARTMLEELDTFIVGERAAKKVEAPARQLGAWLTEVWKDAREDEGALDAQIEAGVMVSFLDDGPLDVIGTGTQRSALATAADEAAIQPPEQAKLEAPPKVETPPAEKVAAEPEIVAVASKKRSPAVLVAGGIAVIALGIVAWKMSRKQEPAQQRVVDTEPAFRDAARASEPDAAMLAAEQPVDAGVASAERAVDAGVVRVRPHPPDHERQRGSAAGSAGSGEGAAVVIAPPPAPAKRKVTINSKPWSFYTVDGGPQHTTPEAVELTPGAHTIHFTGNPYFKADMTVTVTVPDRDGFTYFQTLEATPEPSPAP